MSTPDYVPSIEDVLIKQRTILRAIAELIDQGTPESDDSTFQLTAAGAWGLSTMLEGVCTELDRLADALPAPIANFHLGGALEALAEDIIKRAPVCGGAR